ncbi:ATP-binding cassette domain-containing protein [Nocardioides carbamazepini]|uniref:ABC transporter ATP-binding protein n=1 Tax=Nocardioides carbamazepini TaxID=2854259 RepID=UPI002149EE15|nr:ATP-binding cassette domain-containing protein [Nocardioides carbamazepini]MCR1781797.1 ATP-binding cassette domain-containing protein [Nocardioides carbamazepini]
MTTGMPLTQFETAAAVAAANADRDAASAAGIAPDAVIALRGVSKSFGPMQVLDDVSFDVTRGQITSVLGPSGTGKSVLLNTIIGMYPPEQGQIYVDGEPIVGMRHRDLMRVRRKFGVLFQDGALFGSISLYDNIAFPLREHTDLTEEQVREIVHTKADMVGLVKHLGKMPGEVSGGMKKRAGLARALALDPEIVFFDEPDSGLDPVRVAHLDELMKSVQAVTGCTFFVITHNIDSVRRTADHIGMLFRSKLVAFGPADEVLASERPIVEQFFAGRARGPIGMDEMVDAEVDLDVADELYSA